MSDKLATYMKGINTVCILVLIVTMYGGAELIKNGYINSSNVKYISIIYLVMCLSLWATGIKKQNNLNAKPSTKFLYGLAYTILLCMMWLTLNSEMYNLIDIVSTNL